MAYDDAAQPVTTTLAEYLLPTAPELPMFRTRYQQSPSPVNPLGAKGVGEVGTIPAAAAVISRGRGCAGAVRRAHRRDAAQPAAAGRADRGRAGGA